MYKAHTMARDLYTPSLGFIRWLKCHKPATALALAKTGVMEMAMDGVVSSRRRLYIPPVLADQEGVKDELDRQVDTDAVVMVLAAHPELLGSIPVHQQVCREDLNGGFGILTTFLRNLLSWSITGDKDVSWLPDTEHTEVEDVEVLEYLVKGKVARREVALDWDELRCSGAIWPLRPTDEKKST